MRNCLLMLSMLLLVTGCIEPPLYLPDDGVFAMDVDLETDTVVETGYPQVGYPVPATYEVRRRYAGNGSWTVREAFTTDTTHFRRYVDSGYHGLTVWSNIVSADGTQVLVVNEEGTAVTATSSVVSGTGQTRMRSADSLASQSQRNAPEMFYAARADSIFMPENVDGYDFHDIAADVWVKRAHMLLRPRVYVYLVRIMLRNNDGRIVGCTGRTELSGMASSVDVSGGNTGNTPCLVSFPSRFNYGVADSTGDVADMISGRINTFGLCSMQGYTPGAGHVYKGEATGNRNFLLFEPVFSNGASKILSVDVTDEVRAWCYGGIITVVVDVSSIDIPDDSQGSGGTFEPYVHGYDNISKEFTF